MNSDSNPTAPHNPRGLRALLRGAPAPAPAEEQLLPGERIPAPASLTVPVPPYRSRTLFDNRVRVARAAGPAQGSRKDPALKLRRHADELEAAIGDQIQQSQPQGTQTRPQPVESARLNRIAQYFAAQAELLSQMRSQIEQETSPLIDLLIRNEDTFAYVLANFEERLRPLETYATTEERNLAELQNRLAGDGDHLARSFSDYLGAQRQRIEETRARIAQQRDPFLRFRDDQQQAIEVALSRFDGDIAALEDVLSEQRRVTMRLLDAMRSEAFVAVKEYLAERHEVMVDVATSKTTDPGRITEALRSRRANLPKQGQGAGAEHLNQVLRATDESDRRFASSYPSAQQRRQQPSPPEIADEQADINEFSTVAERVADSA